MAQLGGAASDLAAADLVLVDAISASALPPSEGETNTNSIGSSHKSAFTRATPSLSLSASEASLSATSSSSNLNASLSQHRTRSPAAMVRSEPAASSSSRSLVPVSVETSISDLKLLQQTQSEPRLPKASPIVGGTGGAGTSGGGSGSGSGSVITRSATTASLSGRPEVPTLMDITCKTNWSSPMHVAAWRGDLDEVRHQLQTQQRLQQVAGSQPITEVLERSETLERLSLRPLDVAILRGDVAMAQILIEAGTDPDGSPAMPALYLAASLNQPALVELLLSRGAKPWREYPQHGITPLHIAADKGFGEVVDALLAAPAKLPTLSSSSSSLSASQSSMITATGLVDLASSSGGMTPLHYAASGGHAPIAAKLLAAGASVNVLNRAGNSALHMACSRGHLSVTKLLVEAGADLQQFAGPDGLTPLHTAAAFGEEGYREVVDYLLERGAPVNVKSTEGLFTPLHCAAAKGHYGVCKALLAHGAEVHAMDKYQSTPLRIAAYNAGAMRSPLHFVETANVLLSAGADVNAPNNGGNTPLHSIVKRGDVALTRFLLERGADGNKRNMDGLNARTIALTKGDEMRALFVVEETEEVIGEKRGGLGLSGSGIGGGPPLSVRNLALAAAAAQAHGGGGPLSSPPSSPRPLSVSDQPPLQQTSLPGVYSWRNWMPDELATVCGHCDQSFSITKRRHHCRQCGEIFCAKCSAQRMPLPDFGYTKPVRICIRCVQRAPATALVEAISASDEIQPGGA